MIIFQIAIYILHHNVINVLTLIKLRPHKITRNSINILIIFEILNHHSVLSVLFFFKRLGTSFPDHYRYFFSWYPVVITVDCSGLLLAWYINNLKNRKYLRSVKLKNYQSNLIYFIVYVYIPLHRNHYNQH